MLIKDKRLKNKILPSLDDAIKLVAYSKTISNRKFGLQPKYYRIEESFTIAGKKCIDVSGSENGAKSYHKIFKSYHDREIEILYSPKFDQVLILKDE